MILRPYFWPAAGTDGALINRLRSSATWVLVTLSKITSLIAPFYLITASNDLVDNKYSKAVTSVCIYCALKLSSNILKELQGEVIPPTDRLSIADPLPCFSVKMSIKYDYELIY